MKFILKSKWIFAIPAILAVLIMMVLLGPGLDDPNDDEYLKEG
jgi:hypothetical protein